MLNPLRICALFLGLELLLCCNNFLGLVAVAPLHDVPIIFPFLFSHATDAAVVFAVAPDLSLSGALGS